MPHFGIRPLPLYVRDIMAHLANRIERWMHYPSAEPRAEVGEAFRVDAHAVGQSVGIGGWAPCRDAKGRLSTWESRWFSVEVTSMEAPWAFEKGAPYRSIAALEALATLVGVWVFAPSAPRFSDATATLRGKTDNRGNQFALTRLQTSRYPLCLLTMELSALLEARGQRLLLQWAPRELNEEADRLSNGVTTGFDPAKRVKVDLQTAQWLVLEDLSQAGSEFYRDMQEEKQRRPRAKVTRVGRKKQPTLSAW